MALRGNLRDFSLPDVFQLVTFSRKTGVLRIVREDGATGSVWFRDGDVFFASSNWHADPLGERLVRAQRITPQALSRALDIRSSEPDGGRRLGQILIQEGYITEKVLESFVSEQIQDTIFDLMRWEEGDFDFEAMPDAVEEDIGLSVSIENVVMEGSRRLEEWGRIRKKIPSMDVVFKMATAPGEGTFEISLKPIEWQLLLLIDGTRTVAELATATSRTDFEVARIIYGLFSAGLLEFATEEEIEHNRAERAQREEKLAVIEAERKSAEDAQRRAALERESRLAEEAEKRREAAQRAERVAAGQEAPPAPIAEAPAGPVEEPEFLGSGVSAPSADDQAVLDEFMGAVLQKPSEPAAPVAAKPPAEPYVPVEEPAFISAEHAEDNDMTLIPVPSIEDLLPNLAPPVEAASPEIDAIAASFEEPLEESPVLEVAESVPEASEPAQEVEAPAGSSSDFERELMALGLGEMPSDLLEPMGAPEDSGTAVAPPMSVVPDVVPEAWVAEVGESVPQDTEAEPAGLEGIESLTAELGLPEVVPPAEGVTESTHASIAEEEPDFSALLESLDVDADQAREDTAAAPVASAADAGFDTDLLLEESPADTGGVISTDAFLEDFSGDALGFSGGMTDELSALTGAERRAAPRPQASVNAIPDSAGVLHRDTRVDKDTVLRIIDGIKNL